MIKHTENKHMSLLPNIYQLLKYNPSYFVVLSLFDKVNMDYVSEKGNKAPLSIYQYLSYFGIKNSYLFNPQHPDTKDRLWLKYDKASLKPSLARLDNVIADFDYKNLDVAMKKFSDNLIRNETHSEIIYGLKIDDRLMDDMQYIYKSQYNFVSKKYKDAVNFRSRFCYWDSTIESTITHHKVGYLIINSDSEFREVLSKFLNLEINNKQLFKRIEIKDETIMYKEIKIGT